MAAPTAVRRPGSRANTRMVRMSASKVRVVLNLIRGKRVSEALEILAFSERLAADVIAKSLNSAVANAEHNEDLDADELFVSACHADEGPTLKRYRPRARGRAGRIHKQTCHIMIEVSRYTEEELDEMRAREARRSESRQSRSSSRRDAGGDRARRVAKSRAAAEEADEAVEADEAEEVEAEVAEDVEVANDDVATGDEASDEASEETATSDDAGDETDGATDEVDTDDGSSDDAGDEPDDEGGVN